MCDRGVLFSNKRVLCFIYTNSNTFFWPIIWLFPVYGNGQMFTQSLLWHGRGQKFQPWEGSAPKPDKLLTGRTLASKISSRWAISSEVERFLDTEEVRSSILLSPTNFVNHRRASARLFLWFFREADEKWTERKLALWLDKWHFKQKGLA